MSPSEHESYLTIATTDQSREAYPSFSEPWPGLSPRQQETTESYSGIIQCFFTPVSPLEVSLPCLLLLLLFTISLPKQTLGVEGNGISAVSKPLLWCQCQCWVTSMLKSSQQIFSNDVCEPTQQAGSHKDKQTEKSPFHNQIKYCWAPELPIILLVTWPEKGGTYGPQELPFSPTVP